MSYICKFCQYFVLYTIVLLYYIYILYTILYCFVLYYCSIYKFIISYYMMVQKNETKLKQELCPMTSNLCKYTIYNLIFLYI